jgi:hypothetical protein
LIIFCGLLAELAKLRASTITLELAQVVDKHLALEVIEFMLNANRQ